MPVPATAVRRFLLPHHHYSYHHRHRHHRDTDGRAYRLCEVARGPQLAPLIRRVRRREKEEFATWLVYLPTHDAPSAERQAKSGDQPPPPSPANGLEYTLDYVSETRRGDNRR